MGWGWSGIGTLDRCNGLAAAPVQIGRLRGRRSGKSTSGWLTRTPSSRVGSPSRFAGSDVSGHAHHRPSRRATQYVIKGLEVLHHPRRLSRPWYKVYAQTDKDAAPRQSPVPVVGARLGGVTVRQEEAQDGSVGPRNTATIQLDGDIGVRGETARRGEPRFKLGHADAGPATARAVQQMAVGHFAALQRSSSPTEYSKEGASKFGVPFADREQHRRFPVH